MTKITDDYWMDKEGIIIKITDMASSHLLAAIHMIERRRYENAIESHVKDKPDQTEYYLHWPAQYHHMIAEAQKRHLIHRTPSESLARKIGEALTRKK